MNTIDSDLVYLANKVSDNIHNLQSSDTDFDIKITRTPRKLNTNTTKSKVALTSISSNHPKDFADVHASSSNTKSSRKKNPKTKFNECPLSVGKMTVNSEDLPDEMSAGVADSDKTKLKTINSPEGNQGSDIQIGTVEDNHNDTRFAGFKKSLVSDCNFLPLEELTDDDELWLIMAPKNYKFKKQNVDMTSRQELKGGRFEMQCFNQGSSRNNLTTLVSNDNILVTGPRFKGCIQISEKLQTFSPVYHENVLKEHPIPKGLKERYIPFGSDIKSRDTDKDTENSTEKLNTVDDGVIEGMENSAKHSKIMEVIPTEQYMSSRSKKKKKKKRKHEDSVLSEVDGTVEPPPLNLGNTPYNSTMEDNTKYITTKDKVASDITEECYIPSPGKKRKKHDGSVLLDVAGKIQHLEIEKEENTSYGSILDDSCFKPIENEEKLEFDITVENISSPKKKKRKDLNESVSPEMGDNCEHEEQSNNSSAKKKKKRKEFNESVLPVKGDNCEHEEQSNNSSAKKKKKKKHSCCDE